MAIIILNYFFISTIKKLELDYLLCFSISSMIINLSKGHKKID